MQNQTQTLITQANEALYSHQYEQAISLYDQVLEVDPTLYDVHNKKGIAYKHLAVIKSDNQYNQKAMQEFDLALSKNDKSVLAYSNKAQLHFQFDQHDLANQNIQKSIQLIDENQASEQLDSPQKRFIKSGITHINRIENKFYNVANQVLNEIKEYRESDPDNHKSISEQVENTKIQKNQVSNKIISQINRDKNYHGELSGVRMRKNAKALSCKIDQLANMIDELKEQNESMRQENISLKSSISNLELHQSKMNQVLHELGLYDQLKIKNWFKTYAQTEKYNYAKAFYWTFLNYFDSYRIAWSGVLNKDLHHAEDKNQKKYKDFACNALNYGKSLTNGIPLIGNIFSLIDQAIESVYKKVQIKHYKDRVNAINKIIMDNSTVHLADDLSIVIALASQEIAEVKGSELENKRLKTLTNQKQLRARNYLFRKIDQIKQIILGKEIHLYDNYGGTIALADVITCLAYMEKHYSQMIEHREIPLNEQLVEIVVDDRCYEILDDTTIPEKDLKIVAGNYNPYSEGMPAIQVKQTRDEDSCLKCQIY